MRKVAASIVFAVAFVLFSYGSASAQIVQKVKDVADKTKEVTKGVSKDVAGETKEGTKKVGVVVTDGLEKSADGTEKAAKVGASKTKKFGNTAVNVTENVAGDAYEGGKYYTVKTWDGTKWVSKRVWFATKKTADATKDAVVGEGEQKP